MNPSMTPRLLPLIVLLAFAIPARANPPKREAFEVAVENALQYLSNSQNPDGSWNSGQSFGRGFGGGGSGRDPAVSALSVMAFLSAGHVPGEGKYGAVIEKGIKFVASQQQSNGLFAAQSSGPFVMYSHGICTLMVAEVVGLMPDRAEAARLRKQLELGVRLIKAAQSHQGQSDGGWRYQPYPNDADMSVTAWQVMALRAAKNVGCDVPATIIDRAVEYVKRSQDKNSWGFRYTPYGQVTLACTGAGILSLELCRKEFHGSEESTNAARYLWNRILVESNQGRDDSHFHRQQHFFYGVYYMSQAMFQVGGDYWKRYREYLHWLLLHERAHPQAAGGFWTSVTPDDNMAGVNYCTSMAVLALTVEYRFLPIYQRGEEPEERADK
jgi:hypothetical protein